MLSTWQGKWVNQDADNSENQNKEKKMAKKILALVEIAASNTLHFSACWKGPAVWTTRSTPEIWNTD